jgi:hypothetical protein
MGIALTGRLFMCAALPTALRWVITHCPLRGEGILHKGYVMSFCWAGSRKGLFSRPNPTILIGQLNSYPKDFTIAALIYQFSLSSPKLYQPCALIPLFFPTPQNTSK